MKKNLLNRCADMGTLALPKGRKAYGKGVFVVGRPLSSGNTAEGTQESEPRLLKQLIDEVKKGKTKFDNLIEVISDKATLILAYELIKSKPGQMTRGADSLTLDATSLKSISQWGQTLAEGSFAFTPARRIRIPKPGREEKRPLTIASPRQKVIQKAIALVLEAVYEPIFLNESHGFRPNRGTHSAFKMVDQQFKGVAWVIEAGITKCFDSIPHKRLLEILGRRIKCQKTLNIIESGLQAGFIEFGKLSEGGDTGIAQGSVLSPLLCNIYLHELDNHMKAVMESCNKGKTRRKSLEYARLQYALGKAKSGKERRQIFLSLRNVKSKDMLDPNFVRVKYVRYADDFIVGIAGHKTLAIKIQSEIEDFLKNELDLSLSKAKTKLTHFRSDQVEFLGALIQNRNPQNKKVASIVRGDKKDKARVNPYLSFHISIAKLIRRLVERSVYKWDKTGSSAQPTAVRRLVNLDHADIVRYYNHLIHRLISYYSFADNFSRLSNIVHGLKHSCALTLALKYKLRFRSKVFKRFGSFLKEPETKVQIAIPKTFKRMRKFAVSAPIPLSRIEKAWSLKLTRSGLFKTCVVCGTGPVEMHHLREIKELVGRRHLNWFTIQMAAINRKQIPLCREHHRKLHRNTMSQSEREAFREGCLK
jgi:group II intron reverse transcriptase/maturase